ncbi:MAG: low specificity L-threonine aldolase [Rhodospirillales bacterium]|nr:low specificity L-threonine aldolase [Rhodospirillales bacterium]
MNFSSDNITCACPEIAAAVMAANDGPAMPYGADATTGTLEQTIADLFETRADVFLVATGTAANVLALSVLAPPYGSIYCHPEAHIEVDECGGPEFYTGGAKLVHLPDRNGKITAVDLAEALKDEHGDVHHVKPAAVSLSQTAETGVVYSLDEITAISAVAHEHGLKVHMDGARLANAVAALGCSPAEMTIKAGIDAVSFGASKNGAFAAEAVVIFTAGLADEFAYRRKRGGHLFSKMRFLAVQFETYLKDGLWLKMAGHANDCMKTLAQGLGEIGDVELLFPADANMLFARLPNTMIEGLRNAGFAFYDWPGEERSIIRLITAFNTDKTDIEAFLAEARRLSNP